MKLENEYFVLSETPRNERDADIIRVQTLAI